MLEYIIRNIRIKQFRCVAKYWITDLSMPYWPNEIFDFVLMINILIKYYCGLQQNIGLQICPCHIDQIQIF